MTYDMDTDLIPEWCRELGYHPLLSHKKGLRKEDVDIHVFTQMWGSSATAFPGVGLSAMTTAYTVVLITKYNSTDYLSRVYVNSKHCYDIIEIGGQSKEFRHDLGLQNIACQEGARQRYATSPQTKVIIPDGGERE
jgi:hypothetical protein